ncbi:MAG: hypothetical protein JO212_15280 [Acetobacteraceae bacterium]|nr:hypothetical protein [Acetobacteraceae bacterium]
MPDPAHIVDLLDDLLDFFGPNGEHWTRGLRHNAPRGKHCLVGAIELHCKHPGTMRAVVDYIGAAIWPRSDREYTPDRLMTFNDLCSGGDRIRDVLVRARELARRDMERQQPEIAAARPADFTRPQTRARGRTKGAAFLRSIAFRRDVKRRGLPRRPLTAPLSVQPLKVSGRGTPRRISTACGASNKERAFRGA